MPRRLTRAEYERMGELGFFRGERVELIHGTLVRMPPIGPPHASVVDRLNEIFVLGLAGRARVRIQQPFAVDEETEPEPDVLVAPRADYSKDHPKSALLVIEVAESSLSYDRATKAALYAAAGVPEYWIVDVAARTIEVRTAPGAEGYARAETFDASRTIAPAAFPEILVTVGDLFAGA